MAKLALLGGPPLRTTPYPSWPIADEQEERNVLAVLRSGRWWSTEGRAVAEFEREWAACQHLGHCIAVTNGTHALEVALLACNVGAGDEVIVTDYTFFASASAIACVNAVPVPVDIDRDTLCIDPDAVAAAIGPRTKAVIAVHLAGHPADLDRLVAFCARHGLSLIEDCAHAHGSSWRGTPVGGFGAASAWSFQQSKLLTAGEGGAVGAGSAEIAARARSFADCGRRPGEWFYSHFVLGGNYRMTEWQGAVLRAQLARFDDQNRRRNTNALFLNDELAKLPGIRPQRRDARTTAQGYYCYVVNIDEAELGVSRELVRRALIAEGMPLTMSYPAVHEIAAFTDHDGLAPRLRMRQGWPDFRQLHLPNSRAAAAETLWFKHQLLLGSEDDAADLVRALRKVIEHRDELRTAQ